MKIINDIVEKDNFSDQEVARLEKELNNLAISTEDVYFTLEFTVTHGYGQTHNLGKGWSTETTCSCKERKN